MATSAAFETGLERGHLMPAPQRIVRLASVLVAIGGGGPALRANGGIAVEGAKTFEDRVRIRAAACPRVKLRQRKHRFRDGRLTCDRRREQLLRGGIQAVREEELQRGNRDRFLRRVLSDAHFRCAPTAAAV